MSLPNDSDPVPADLESALNERCAALVALQTLQEPAVLGPADAGGAMYHLRQVTSLLRATIDELRAASDQDPSLLAFGFVLASETGGAAPLQVSPRRTA